MPWTSHPFWLVTLLLVVALLAFLKGTLLLRARADGGPARRVPQAMACLSVTTVLTLAAAVVVVLAIFQPSMG